MVHYFRFIRNSMKGLYRISLILIAFIALFNNKSYSQSLNDVDTVWMSVVPMRSSFTGIVTLANGNYLAYGWNDYSAKAAVTNSTGSNVNEVYLAEFTEAGNIIRYKTIPYNMPTPVDNDSYGRNYITHSRVVERPDHGLLILSEFEHGGGGTATQTIANIVAQGHRFMRIITDQNWNVVSNGVHDVSVNNYVHSATTYDKMMARRLMTLLPTGDGRIIASLSGTKRLGAVYSSFQGVVFLDFDGNLASGTNNDVKISKIDGTATNTVLLKDGSHYLVTEDGTDIFRSTDLNCTAFTAFNPIPSCVGPCISMTFGKNIIALPNVNGYAAYGRTGDVSYSQAQYQTGVWKWNSSLAIQTPTPSWFQGDITTGTLFLMNNAVYDAASQDRFLTIVAKYVANTATINERRISQFVFAGTGAAVYTQGPLLHLRPSSTFGMSQRSVDNDGIIGGGNSTASGQTQMIVGKLSACAGFKLDNPGDTSYVGGCQIPAYIFSTTGAYTGATLTYEWKMTLKSGAVSIFSTVPGTVLASGTSYTIPAITFPVTTSPAVIIVEYKAKQSWGTPVQNCNTSAAYEITLTNLVSGTVGSNQSICYNTKPAAFTQTVAPSGGIGSYTYQWQKSTTNNGTEWADISGATATDYTPPDALTETTYYRRAVTSGASGTCGTVYNTVITVTVMANSIVSIMEKDSICIGTTTLLSPHTGGVWASSNSAVATIQNNGFVTGVSVGYAVFTFTNANNCSATSDTVRVNSFPIVNNITGDDKVCVGSTVQLTNTTAGGVWSINNSNVSIDNPSANPVTITGVSVGNTYITYTAGTSVCQTKKTFPLKIISTISPKILIGF
jgi:hypothetical protein